MSPSSPESFWVPYMPSEFLRAVAVGAAGRRQGLGEHSLQHGLQQPGDARFDVDDRVGEPRVAPVQRGDLGPGVAICQNAPDIAVAAAMRSTPSRSVSSASRHRTTATIASTSARVTSLKARTASRETWRSRLSGACASRSQNKPRAASVLANTPATAAGVGAASSSSPARSAVDHSRHPSAVSRRKISSRVSK